MTESDRQMNHPPIPEGHERFSVRILAHEKYDAYLLPVAEIPTSGFWYNIEELKGYHRQDCAAHAAAEWYKRSILEDGSVDCTAEQLRYENYGDEWIKWGNEIKAPSATLSHHIVPACPGPEPYKAGQGGDK